MANESGSAASAKEAFQEAKRLYEQFQFDEAADKFREAYRLKPTWKLLFNIGQAEAAAKRYGLALEAFQNYVAQAGDDIEEGRQEEVFKEIARLKQLVGYLDVDAPEGSIVLVDGVTRGQTPLGTLLLISAGVKHHVLITNGELELYNKRIAVMGDKSLRIEVDVDSEQNANLMIPSSEALPPAAESTREEAAASAPGRTLRISGLIVGAIGLGTIVAGSVTGGMALGLDKQIQKDCDGTICDPATRNDRNKMETLGMATNALFIAGGTLLATAVVLFVAGSVKKKKTESLSAFPAAAPGFVGLNLVGRF
jgi:hypothetical protein